MVTTTLLLALASLGGIPAAPTPPARALPPERPAGIRHLFVPTGTAVPVAGDDQPDRLADLFPRRIAHAAANVTSSAVPDLALMQRAMRSCVLMRRPCPL